MIIRPVMMWSSGLVDGWLCGMPVLTSQNTNRIVGICHLRETVSGIWDLGEML